MNDLNLTFPPDVDDWSPERGYSNNATPTTFPWKAAGSTEKITQLVFKRSNKRNIVMCMATKKSFTSSRYINTQYLVFRSRSSSRSETGPRRGDPQLLLLVREQCGIQGEEGENHFRQRTNCFIARQILLHNPMETPKMADFANFLPPTQETRITVTPRIYDATPTLRGIDIMKRNCYFPNERRLRYYRCLVVHNLCKYLTDEVVCFRTYTQRNCKLECETNYTLGKCDCVPFFLPSKSRRI